MGSVEMLPAFTLSRRLEKSAIPRAPFPENNTFKVHLPPTWTTSTQHSTCPFVLPCSRGDISPVPHCIPADIPLLPTATRVLDVPRLQQVLPCLLLCYTFNPAMSPTPAAPPCQAQPCNPPYPQDRDSCFCDSVPAGAGALHVSLYRDPLCTAMNNARVLRAWVQPHKPTEETLPDCPHPFCHTPPKSSL